jgi:hypothetical protein
MQEYQHIFRSAYIEQLKRELKSQNRYQPYLEEKFDFNESEVIDKTTVKTDYPELIMPVADNNYDLENAKILFGAYKSMRPVDATDVRIWTYLSHVTYWKYMRIRRPVEKQPTEKRAGYVLQHWFIESLSPGSLMRQDIAMLWWAVYMTYDESRKNPYELTEELFSMLDYTRHLLPGIQGRSINFTHAILEFVIENKDLFSKHKESRVRFIMRKANYIAGYKNFNILDKKEIKLIFDKYKGEISGIIEDIKNDEE